MSRSMGICDSKGRTSQRNQLRAVARPKDLIATTVRHRQIRHVLDDAEHFTLERLHHLDAFDDDLGRQHLRRGDDDDAIERQRLHDGHRRVRGTGR